MEFCSAHGTVDLLLSPVDGRVALAADVERVELVVVQLVLVARVLVAGLRTIRGSEHEFHEAETSTSPARSSWSAGPPPAWGRARAACARRSPTS